MRNTVIAVCLACVIAPAAHAQEMQAFVAQYDLSDGRVLTISRHRNTLVAQLDGQTAVLLQPSGPASFTARDGTLRIEFDQRRNGNVAGVTVIRAPDALLARR
jgi:hypothetical protein